jgi:hypothetical protein
MRLHVWLIACGMFVVAGQAADPADKPYLRIETGMYTAVVRRIDTDATGRFLVTASNDKTARVWDRVPEITEKQFGYGQTPMLEITGQTLPIARKTAC